MFYFWLTSVVHNIKRSAGKVSIYSFGHELLHLLWLEVCSSLFACAKRISAEKTKKKMKKWVENFGYLQTQWICIEYVYIYDNRCIALDLDCVIYWCCWHKKRMSTAIFHIIIFMADIKSRKLTGIILSSSPALSWAWWKECDIKVYLVKLWLKHKYWCFPFVHMYHVELDCL